ncbi:hypothetical protein [Yersinia intermedia]|uniref:hypothetical protein n=1 Tax=Yersinia intermedia TaxID=631 RepID=UPI00065D7675|nr:hypothetical protein [Yersinia intermedia]CRY84051.1 Uncharacterised protein [Yersinia intermedia]
MERELLCITKKAEAYYLTEGKRYPIYSSEYGFSSVPIRDDNNVLIFIWLAGSLHGSFKLL